MVDQALPILVVLIAYVRPRWSRHVHTILYHEILFFMLHHINWLALGLRRLCVVDWLLHRFVYERHGDSGQRHVRRERRFYQLRTLLGHLGLIGKIVIRR